MDGKVKINDKESSLAELSKSHNIPYRVLYDRIHRYNMDLDSALRKPYIAKTYKIYTYRGVRGNLGYLFRYFDKPYQAAYRKIKKGMSIEEVFNSNLRSSSKNIVYTYRGISGSLRYLCRCFNKKYYTIVDRIKKGMSIEEAFDTPLCGMCPNRGKIYTYKKISGNLMYLCEYFNKNYNTIVGRINKGFSLDEAFETPIKQKKYKRRGF